MPQTSSQPSVFDSEHVFVAILGGAAAGVECALRLRELGVPALLLADGRWLERQDDLCRVGAPFVCNANVTQVSDAGGWFRLVVAAAGGIHVISARHLAIADREGRRSAPALSASIFTDSDHRVRGGSFFEGKSVAILGGDDGAFECYAHVKRQNPKELRLFARAVTASQAWREALPSSDIEEGGYDCHVHEAENGRTACHVITVHDDPFARFCFEHLVCGSGDDGAGMPGVVRSVIHPAAPNPRILTVGAAPPPDEGLAASDWQAAASGLHEAFLLESRRVA